MSRGIIAAIIVMFIKSLFYGLSGYNPYKQIDSVLKYFVDFGFFILLYIPVDYLIGLLKIGRKYGEEKEPKELL